MSDFIFSTGCLEKDFIKKKFSKIYNKSISIKSVSTNYGELAFVENHYNGYKEYETEQFICTVVGGPILNFRNNRFITDKDSNEGTKAIYQRWIVEDIIIWDKDISGPYVIIYFNKINGDLKIITDMMSFIPLYENTMDNELILGTHIDVLSDIKNNEVDQISIADFIMSEVITYPFTAYKKIKQLQSGSTYSWSLKNSYKFKHEHYWLPEEPKEPYRLNDLSKKLRKGFLDYLNRAAQPKSKIGAFLSGGVDSRIIVSTLSKEIKVDSFIFVDKHNRESRVAKKVADKIDSCLRIQQRDFKYYFDILEPACDLIGLTSEYVHVHSYGLVESCNLDKYDGVFGGFLADTFLKGHHIKRKNIPKYLQFLPIPQRGSELNNIKLEYNTFIKNAIVDEVNERRIKHRERVKKIRPNSKNEWFNIWPITMHNDTANIHGNRRLFKNFEPFTSSEIIKISALAIQTQKLNNKLFHKAMKPLLTHTKYIPHANGALPYYPWYINTFIRFIYNVLSKINIFKKEKNEGPWTDWEDLLSHQSSKIMIDKNIKFVKKNINSIFKNNFNYQLTNESNIKLVEKRILIQLGYHFSKK